MASNLTIHYCVLKKNYLSDGSSLAADNWDGSSLPLEEAECPVSHCQLIIKLYLSYNNIEEV